jgi:hypothetical protein
MSVSMPRTMTRGVVFIHSTPKLRCARTSVGARGVLGQRVTGRLDRSTGRARPRPRRAHLVTGRPGTGARIASALRGWDNLRYEVTEEPEPGLRRLALVAHAHLGRPPHVDLGQLATPLINEDRLREVVETRPGQP